MSQRPILTGQDIAEAYGAVQSLLERGLAGTGTTNREYVVLRVLAARGPVDSPASLHAFLAAERQLDLTPTAAGELLARLEARALATGTAKDNPRPTELTPKGAELLRNLADRVTPGTGQLFSSIPAEDLATAHRVLRDIIDRAPGIASTESGGVTHHS
jgi:DNA-binding MarR family transcriptional regulator